MTGDGSTAKPSEIIVRPARKADSGTIAALFRISSDGLSDYIWSRLDESPSRPLIEIGRERYEREGVPFSYQNCFVAERAGAVVGMVHAYPMEQSEPEDEERQHGQDPGAEEAIDPVLAPYSELEDYGSLYLSGVAVSADHRGCGIGTRLIAATQARAAKEGWPRMSLICFDANVAAMRLYRRLGFIEIKRRPLVPHPCLKYDHGDALLLARPLIVIDKAPDGLS